MTQAIGVVINKTSRIFISNIPQCLIDEHGENALREVCDKYGDVLKYVLFSDNAGHFTGSAMCTYATPAQAKIAVRELLTIENPDGTMVHAAIAKEHGVAELSHVKTLNGDDVGAGAPQRQQHHRGGRAGGGRARGVDEGGRWTHDMYHRRIDGNDWRGGNNFRGARGAGRGGYRGGRGQFHPFRGGEARGRGGRGRASAFSSTELDAQLDQYAALRQQEDAAMTLEGYAGDGSAAVAGSNNDNEAPAGNSRGAPGQMDEES